ncbi:DUF6879 family protein [Streptomyces sp. NPDC048410]|uniref:DUF6879 family protein n=1 Tax=Streptomyces sp. NPDC048410 TaxID=3365545 RepID=UPI00371456D9
MRLAGSEWRAFFDSMEREAWRLETLPVYSVPQEAEAIREFADSGVVDPAAVKPWVDRLHGYASAGRNVGRVHVVRRPLTEYLKFEFEHYRHNVAAGEDVRILDVTDRPDPLAGAPDFWIFDQARVVLMQYEVDGTQVGREVYEGDVTPFLELRRVAIAEAVPFEEYVKGIGT